MLKKTLIPTVKRIQQSTTHSSTVWVCARLDVYPELNSHLCIPSVEYPSAVKFGDYCTRTYACLVIVERIAQRILKLSKGR